jgi:serine/threonine-protein kinase
MESPDPLLGRLLGGRYRLVRFIARGGMGEVFEATDERGNGPPVAIKLLRHELSADEEWCARFKREADIASAIHSPYVAHVLHVGKTNTGRRWIAFEYLEGESLGAQVARSGPVPFTDLAWMVDHALAALEAAHRIGVVHRDIKPGNLFLVARETPPRLCVLDFGVAKRARPSKASSGLTRADATLGTPLYMSPEQLVDPREVDARTDLYGLGLVVFHALTGQAPFRHRDPGALFTGKWRGDVPRLAMATRVSWSEELEGWLAQMVAPDRDERLASARAARNAWQQATDAMRDHVPVPVAFASFHEDTDVAPLPALDTPVDEEMGEKAADWELTSTKPPSPPRRGAKGRR